MGDTSVAKYHGNVLPNFLRKSILIGSASFSDQAAILLKRVEELFLEERSGRITFKMDQSNAATW